MFRAALLSLLISSTYVLALQAHALVPAPCNYQFPPFPGTGTSLTVTPNVPNSNQTVDIAVGYSELGPLAVATQTQGNVISVTLTAIGYFRDISPPAPCMSATVGPLAPGTYAVNYYLADVTNARTSPGSATPQFIRSSPLNVVAAGDSLSCFAPSQSKPICSSNPGCIFVCPQTPGSSAKLNLTLALSQLPSDGCVSKLSTSVTDGAIRVAGTYSRCPAGSPPSAAVTYSYPSLEPLAAGPYALTVEIAPDANYPAMPSPTPIVLNSSIDVAASTSTQPNFQGLWWAAPAGSESGWGLNIAHQGSLIFLSWFTFDFDGKAHWFVSTLQQAYGDFADFGGSLYDVTGPGFDAAPFPPIGSPGGATGYPRGGISLRFSDANSGSFTGTVDDYPRNATITREAFGRVPNCTWGVETDLSLAPNYTDLWWASPGGSEAGWGINLTHQDNIIFATWFTYDHDRTPMWLAVQANKTGASSYAGTLIKAVSGPPLDAKPFPPLGAPGGAVGAVVGTATFAFWDGNAAAFTYTVDGVTQTTSITREVFVGPGTVCQ